MSYITGLTDAFELLGLHFFFMFCSPKICDRAFYFFLSQLKKRTTPVSQASQPRLNMQRPHSPDKRQIRPLAALGHGIGCTH